MEIRWHLMFKRIFKSDMVFYTLRGGGGGGGGGSPLKFWKT